MEEDKNIETLIVKHFDGEASAQEQKEILDWIKEDSSNKEEFHKMKQMHDALALQTKTFTPKPLIQHKKKSTNIIKFISIAASAAASIIFVFLYFSQTDNFIETNGYADKIKEIELEDGSQITINKSASIQHIEEFSHNRKVNLIGEAYFNVASDPQHPFTINAGEVTIEVIGTEFNVLHDTLVKQVTVSVTEGKVKCSSGAREIYLTANKAAQFSYDKGSLNPFQTTNNNHLAWKTNILEFKNTPLQEVIPQLNKYYGVSFKFADDSIKQNNLSIRIDNTELEHVIKIIEMTSELKVTQEGNTYTISK